MKNLNYYKNNCKEDYLHTPISVLRYITELEKEVESKPLIIDSVIESVEFNADEIIAFLNDCETLDEAKMFADEHLR